MKTKNIAFVLSVIAMSLCVSYFALAVWNEAPANPPSGNIDSPLNTSVNAQSKEGALVLGTNSALTTGLIVQYGNVGIGTTNPGAKLEVAGQLKVTGGTPGAGKVLVSDSAGLASWKTPSSNIMYLRREAGATNPQGYFGCPTYAPAACPSGWTQADLQTTVDAAVAYYGGGAAIYYGCVRTCYRTNTQCQVIYLEREAGVTNPQGYFGCPTYAPAACPSGWTQADLQTIITEAIGYYGGGAATYYGCVRTCYLCQ